jgi:hypothetical protein
MNVSYSAELEFLSTNNFVKRCQTFIKEGGSKNYPRMEKKLWEEFKKLTLLPVAFKKKVDEEKILEVALTEGYDPYNGMVNILKDLLAKLEEKKNSYADHFSSILILDKVSIKNSLFSLYDLGSFSIDIVAAKVDTLYLHPYFLEDFLSLENTSYFGDMNQLKNIYPEEYSSNALYFSLPESLFSSACEIHVFYRAAKTNSSKSDETVIFFQTKRNKFTPFLMASNMRERFSSLDHTINQSCFLCDPETKSKAKSPEKLIDDLDLIFKISPVINKYYRLKKEKLKLYYNDGYFINEKIEDIKETIKESPSNKNSSECELKDSHLWKTFLKKE